VVRVVNLKILREQFYLILMIFEGKKLKKAQSNKVANEITL